MNSIVQNLWLRSAYTIGVWWAFHLHRGLGLTSQKSDSQPQNGRYGLFIPFQSLIEWWFDCVWAVPAENVKQLFKIVSNLTCPPYEQQQHHLDVPNGPHGGGQPNPGYNHGGSTYKLDQGTVVDHSMRWEPFNNSTQNIAGKISAAISRQDILANTGKISWITL